MTRLLLIVATALLGLPQTSSAQVPVTLQLQWTHAFQFAGYYAAKELGYYAEAGLDVTLREPTEDISVAEIVTRGDAQFGIGNSNLLVERARGLPIVALATTLQHSPYVLVVPFDSPAQSIEGVAGLRVMLESSATDLEAFLRRAGVADKIERVAHSFDPQDLVDGNADAYSAYSTNELFYFLERGFNILTYSPLSAGIDFYGDTLFTSEEQIRNHPERVQAFREASLRGWEYALTHTEEIIKLIIERYPTIMSAEHLRYEAAEQLRLMDAADVELGTMSTARWRAIADVYAELEMMPAGFDLSGFLYDAPSRPSTSDPTSAPTEARPTFAIFAALGALSLLGLVGFMGVRMKRRIDDMGAELAVTEYELEESERRYQLLANNMREVVWTLDVTALRFTFVSPSVQSMLGYTPEEIMARTLDQAIPPAQLDIVRKRIETATEALRGGNDADNSLHCVIEQKNRDGGKVRLDVRCHAHINAHTGKVELCGTLRRLNDRSPTPPSTDT